MFIVSGETCRGIGGSGKRIASRLGWIGLLGQVIVLVGMGSRLQAQDSVLTQQYDNRRTGAYLLEQTLTPRRVDPTTGPGMQMRYEIWAGGVINAQLLYEHGLHMADGSVHNVLFVPTMANTVSAWDADSGVQLWNTTLSDGDPHSNRTLPREGVYSTPVISGTKMYVVYNTWNGVAFPPDGSDPPSTVDLQYWLAALDIRDGHLIRLQRVAGHAPSNVAPGVVDFVPKRHVQRPGLLLAPDPTRPGSQDIYIGFGSRWHEEKMNYHGWVMRYDAGSLAYRGAFCSTPDRRDFGEGGGVWQGSGALTGDDLGNVYFCTGNGDIPPDAYGNAIVKLTPSRDSNGHDQLTATAFSAPLHDPAHAQEWLNNDIDLGSGGLMVLPGATNVVGGGKTGILYLLATANMSRIQEFAGANNTYVNPSQYESNRYGDGPDPEGQGAWAMGPHLYGAPVFWQGANSKYALVYVWGEKDALKGFRYYWNQPTHPFNVAQPLVGHDSNGPVIAPLDVTPGGSLALSANGASNAIVWATAPTDSGGRLLAFDALTLRKLWEEPLPGVAHFIPPTIADGTVFIATADGHFRAYGLATTGRHTVVRSSASAPAPLGSPAPRVALLLRQVGRKAAALTPPDAVPLFVAPATGATTYVCRERPDAPGHWEWVARTTAEMLIDEVGTRPNVAYQGRGDTLANQVSAATWEAHDGSRLHGDLQASVPAPAPDALPWQLWKRDPASPTGAGLFAPVTYLLRLDTQGGMPTLPADSANAGKEVRVTYSALYVVYGPKRR